MAIVKPFKAVRATRDKVALVSSKSYEAYTPAELGAKLDFNPFTFLHVINPGYKYHQEVSGEQRFQLVHNRFLEFKENGIFLQDEKESFYIYEKKDGKNSYCGIIAGSSVDDYENDIIKKHEGTIEKREILFENYLKTTGFNAEPVLLTYPDNDSLETIIKNYKETVRPEYEFSTTDKKLHKFWVITETDLLDEIKDAFKTIDSIYIADGHHRSASSYLLAKNLRKENPNHTGKEAYNYFMTYLIPESHLQISEFNRFVKDLNGLTVDDFLMKLDASFRIENHGAHYYYPSKKNHFSMYLEGTFYSLYLRRSLYKFTDALSKLDAEILFRTILKPILGIDNLNNNNRIGYSHTKKDVLSVKTKVDDGTYKVGFGLLPISVNEMKEVADNNLKMPPKTTYIEPKLRSGLTMYEF
ncbi:uncharacterized protein (DUF1015 family) [Lutibacter sp. Hel_I_33_5]|uniref:DUF1015 domain-containing protein n=1 Tax=Lutibacter sp. Hel_I_33_5 TaxID=1566289 RepID=UPI0011A1FAF0|nr:DUF1015 domain-containing protein [Lutibacter sp. Hel_I_33_5]TVZ55092.1 uncharacterized protein (DUF1015 family) [Lutibacter sp. Hel_I_33_5]